MIQELFFDRDIQEDEEENTETNEESTTSKVSKSDIKLEVINGSGENNLLQKAVKELEGAGYKVSRTGTTNNTLKTTIVDKRTTTKQAILNNIKDTLGVGIISSGEGTTGSSKVDVTIIIGKDYK